MTHFCEQDRSEGSSSGHVGRHHPDCTAKDAGLVTVLDDINGSFEAGHLSAIMGGVPHIFFRCHQRMNMRSVQKSWNQKLYIGRSYIEDTLSIH